MAALTTARRSKWAMADLLVTPGFALCRRCHTVKAESDFQPAMLRSSRWCRPCRYDYERDYTARTPKDRARRSRVERDRARRMMVEDPDWNRKQQLKTRYNKTWQWWVDTLAAQGGMCANPGCDGTPTAVDHDHACCPGGKSCGECVRGILCRSCNHLLGNARDSVEVLEGAVAYLTSWNTGR